MKVTPLFDLHAPSVAAWEYLDINAPLRLAEPPKAEAVVEHKPQKAIFCEEEVAARVQAALADAQQAWQRQHQEAQSRRDQALAAKLEAFASERSTYFRQVESEIVQLSLAIARRILQREVALDPTLLSGLVRIVLDRIGAEPPIRVSSGVNLRSQYELAADPGLKGDDCVLETSSGTAEIGFEAQLKEVERSFLDLLARRPETA